MRMRVALVPAALAVLAAAVLSACGSSGLTVYGAASLKELLPKVETGASYSFAGSDALARQIEDGAPADLFAAASPKYPKELAAKDRCEKPLPFATNTLTVIVPANEPKVSSFADFKALDGARIAVGVPSVPIGAYSRDVLSQAGAESVLQRNTISGEQDASGVVSKVALGSADAGLVYVTDAQAAGGKVRSVSIPASAQATVVYMACVVKRDGANTAAAQEYLDKLTGADGQAALREVGFGPAPAQ